MRPRGILICVPAYGQTMTAETASTVYSLGQYLTAQGILNSLSWFSAADIVETRNLFLSMWYDTQHKFSHMLFIDSDNGFSPMLVRDMIKFGKPLMGALYAKRQMNPAVVGTLPEGHSTKDIVDGFMRANTIGGGVMMISREVVGKMLSQMPELSDRHSWLLKNCPFPLKRIIRAFDPIKDETRRLSEDVSFCERWKECGGEVWANVAHKISHIGYFDFHMRYQGMMETRENNGNQNAA